MSGPNVNYAYQIKNQHLRFRLRGKIVTCNKLAQHMRGQRLGLSLFDLIHFLKKPKLASVSGHWSIGHHDF